jgi:hypothetical protein
MQEITDGSTKWDADSQDSVKNRTIWWIQKTQDNNSTLNVYTYSWLGKEE